MAYIGIDLGGTKVHVAKIDKKSSQKACRLLIPKNGTEQEVLNVIIDAITQVIDQDVVAIGIGVPSIVDQQLGIVYDVQNIPSWKKVYLKELLEVHFGCPVYVNNDANCFSLGELFFGAGKEANSFIGLTIGTGIAGGIIINNKLYNGFNTGAGEFGMLPYLEQNFEYYCSGQFFENIHFITGQEAFEKANSGDLAALAMYTNFGKHLGNLITQVLYTYDPELIILGGSVSRAYSFFKDGIYSSLEKFAFQNSISNLKIVVSEDSDIAVKGAAALCYQ